LSWEKINSLKVLKAKRKIFRLNHEDAPEFTNLIRSLAQRMDIPYARITLWSAITKNKFPSVEEDKMGEIHLVIPISFLRFFEENPGQAEAVLAHEFGHVLQKDTHLFHIADAYFDVIRSIWLPTAYLNIVLKILIMLWHIETVIMVMQTYMLLTCVVLGSFVFDVLVIRYMTKGFKDLRQSRRESEKLADIAACVFADASALNEVLSSENNEVAAITGKNDSVHPSKSERRKNIKHILQSTPV
jgi:hypothetical protein